MSSKKFGGPKTSIFGAISDKLTLRLDRDYLRNATRRCQSENGKQNAIFSSRVRLSRSRSSKVIDFGTNWKRVCDFLLVRHSNLVPILNRFRDFARFLYSWPHPYSTIILGCSHCTRSPILGSMWAGTLSYSAVKLFSKYSNLCDHAT